MVTARYRSALTGDHEYNIPEYWLMGFQTGNPGATLGDAVAQWAYQAYLADLEEENNG